MLLNQFHFSMPFSGKLQNLNTKARLLFGVSYLQNFRMQVANTLSTSLCGVLTFTMHPVRLPSSASRRLSPTQLIQTPLPPPVKPSKGPLPPSLPPSHLPSSSTYTCCHHSSSWRFWLDSKSLYVELSGRLLDLSCIADKCGTF